MNELPQEITDAVEKLTEMRYEDPTFTGEECIELKSGIVKMRVESWTYDCLTHARERGKKIEDSDEEIFQHWQREEAEKGFTLINDSFDFDSQGGDSGQHFAFYYKEFNCDSKAR